MTLYYSGNVLTPTLSVLVDENVPHSDVPWPAYVQWVNAGIEPSEPFVFLRTIGAPKASYIPRSIFERRFFKSREELEAS